jgi:hypothetical protein
LLIVPRFVPLLGDPLRVLDVVVLGGLVAAAQQQDQLVAVLQVVDPVTGAVANPQLGDAFADRLDVTEVAAGEPVDADEHASGGTPILQFPEPAVEGGAADHLRHL